MKYIIVFTLFLTGCDLFERCPPKKYREDLIYNDRVEVIGGFFKGQVGFIRGQNEVYVPSACNVEGFRIELINGKKEINVEQDLLKKKPVPAPVVRCEGYPFCEVEK